MKVAEATILYGSGSGKYKMNESGSSEKNIGSGSGRDKNLPLPPLVFEARFFYFYENFQNLNWISSHIGLQ